MTFLNFLFIAGAAAVQSGSGWLIATRRQAGDSAAGTFATLHWSFAALLLGAAVIYAFAPRRPATP
jgi:hypothetical protein